MEAEVPSSLPLAKPCRYVYTPFRPIRLIELLPGKDQNPLSCVIRHVDLSSLPKYEALSYVWGDESNKVTILCDGAEVSITRNLAAALRRFRPEESGSPPRILWTDSICINQNDTTEKETQIPFMGRIYSQASTVLIWLGEENQSTEKAMDCIQDLCSHLRPRAQEFMSWKADSISMDEMKEMEKQGLPESTLIRDSGRINRHFGIKPADSGNYEALADFFQRPWFTRAWTFQESWLAQKRRFICGRWDVSADDLLFAMRALWQLLSVTEDSRYNFQATPFGMLEGRGFWRHKPKDTLLELLILRRGSGCKYPQDLIYSILGSVRDTLGIKIKYASAWQSVFAEFAYKHMENSGSLSILGQIDCEAHSTDLPSWVPDWRAKSPRHRRFTDPIAGKGIFTYTCCGSSPPKLRLSKNFLELTLFGFELDTVSAVIGCYQAQDLHQWSKRWLALDSKELYQPTSETVDTVLSRVRCADLALHDEENPKARWGADAIQQINYLADTERGPLYTGWLKRQMNANSQSCYFATKKGRLGLAPKSIHDGDLVCLVIGGEVPLLLRRGSSDGAYRFVGECYLHGYMDGEGLIEEYSRVDPYYNTTDRDFLNRLHLDHSPIEAQEFCVI
jgi:hypothetical protein